MATQAATTGGLARMTAAAVVPEQLLPYLSAVSPLKPRAVGRCLALMGEGLAVLVGYPAGDPRDAAAVDEAVAALVGENNIRQLTVLAAARPAAAPAGATVHEDAYWSIPLPAPVPGQKLRNMLKRAGREVAIGQSGGKDAWTPEHAAMVEAFIRRKALDAGSAHIFRHIPAYLAAAPDARLFSARRPDGRLAACAVGDYSSFSTAFYMFAFRAPDAPPGTADALLAAIAAEGEARGHALLDLGLGIDPGVAFFKKKWGATLFLPYVETSWEIARKGFLGRLFGR